MTSKEEKTSKKPRKIPELEKLFAEDLTEEEREKLYKHWRLDVVLGYSLSEYEQKIEGWESDLRHIKERIDGINC